MQLEMEVLKLDRGGDLVVEEWRTVQDYEGFYEVSNKGRVRSLDRVTFTKRGKGFHSNRKGKVLAQNKDKDGYPRVIFSKNGVSETPSVHRLVATAFIENPKEHPVINHKNEIKDDNNVDNLEWCTISYNNVYGNRAKKAAKKQMKPVIGTDEKTGKQRYFESISSVEEHGFNMSHVIDCAKGRRNRHLGHTWEYVQKKENSNNENIRNYHKN